MTEAMKRLPNIPTFEEPGVQTVSITHRAGIVAPAQIPRSKLAALHGHIVKALRDRGVVQRLNELGAVQVGDSPAEFQKFVENETVKWKQGRRHNAPVKTRRPCRRFPWQSPW